MHYTYGNTEMAVKETNYEWLMFYSCIYVFGIWDAYKYAEPQTPAYSYLPFVIAAFLGTVGVIYSPTVRIFGCLLGSIWLPIICIVIGIVLGIVLRLLIIKYSSSPNKYS